MILTKKDQNSLSLQWLQIYILVGVPKKRQREKRQDISINKWQDSKWFRLGHLMFSTVLTWTRPISNGKWKSSNMISNNPVSHVHVVHIVWPNFSTIGPSSSCLHYKRIFYLKTENTIGEFYILTEYSDQDGYFSSCNWIKDAAFETHLLWLNVTIVLEKLESNQKLFIGKKKIW